MLIENYVEYSVDSDTLPEKKSVFSRIEDYFYTNREAHTSRYLYCLINRRNYFEIISDIYSKNRNVMDISGYDNSFRDFEYNLNYSQCIVRFICSDFIKEDRFKILKVI
jgi:hypothetical protein